jgi:muramoyltetrapeptide carboxypeptidase
MSLMPVPVLSAGSRVAVVAPAGPFDPAKLSQGLSVLAARYRVELDPAAHATHRYLAGDDDARLASLMRAHLDTDVGAIVAARGGYGSSRLLERIQPKRPQILLGFSDITALHLLWQRNGFRSVHGPVVTQLGTQGPEVVERLFSTLEGQPVPPLVGTETVRPGSAEGPLMGGNLAILASLVGTPFFPSLNGAVLLLEDVGERPYRLDRMWTQLVLSGALRGVAGVALGAFTDCEEKDASYTSAQVLSELTFRLNVPVLAGLPIGHGSVNHPVVLGARVRLDATAKRLETPEGVG